jgi:hypothetical protein
MRRFAVATLDTVTGAAYSSGTRVGQEEDHSLSFITALPTVWAAIVLGGASAARSSSGLGWVPVRPAGPAGLGFHCG